MQDNWCGENLEKLMERRKTYGMYLGMEKIVGTEGNT